MKDYEIIKAIAELAGIIKPNGELTDGYCWYKGYIWTTDNGDGLPDSIWSVLTSRDAIVPVIEKQSHTVIAKVSDWINNNKKAHKSQRTISLATATQLCEALLRATGKWKD